MRPSIPLIKGLVALLLFGSVPCTVRYVSFNSITIGVVRLAVASAGLGLLLLGLKRFQKLSSREWRFIVCAGIAFGLHWLFYFIGIKYSSAALGALGFSTYGIQLIILGWVLKLNPVRLTHVLGVLLAVFGSILVVPEFSLESDVTIGLMSGILSGTFYAVLPVLHQKNKSVDDDVRAWGQFTFALLVFLPLAPYGTWIGSVFEWGLVLYLGVVVTLVGHTLWVHASTALPTTTTSLISYLYLPTAIFLGWLLLDEVVDQQVIVGAGCILLGNLIGLYKRSPEE
jgi:drug/metabolite transporter (DMT)-like permease